MNKEDYNKFYIQGSDHYLIPKDVFDELFNEMSNWKEDTKKYKEVIDKLKKHCEIEINASNHYLENHNSQKELCHKVAHQRILDILKEAQNEKN